MKVLHINDIANVGSTLVAGLKQLGHTADLRRLRLFAAKQPSLVKMLALPWRLYEISEVNREIKRVKYDVVHIHFAYLGWTGIVGGYPYFLHCHGSDVRRWLRDPIRRRLFGQSLGQARSVFYSTPDLAQPVSSVRPDALFLPNPVNVTHFEPVTKAENQQPVRVLIISELSPIKKASVAFEAVKRLIANHPEVQVTAINRGLDRSHYYDTPGVTFTAPVPYEDMPALINAHDIVIGQFGIGSIGMAELEGLACGKPVICYFKYGDCYPHPPPLFSTDRLEQVVNYLIALVEDPKLRRESGEQSRAWVLQYHSYISIARQLEQIYCGVSQPIH